MKTYKVKSNIKHNGDDYKQDEEIKLNKKDAKTLIIAGAIIDPYAKEEEKDKPTSIDAANREIENEEKEQKEKKEDNPTDNKKENKTDNKKTHTITEEDMTANPDLADRGVKVGDKVEIPEENKDTGDNL